ncbi:RNA-binding protein [Bacillus horti]|uniref:RNA-binding protein YlmH n=1 Tax=Caldalkalibacillus horti TaxID=77523 RepID=A0ABT9VVG8_9BACI|nr:RNA-binding protein YlmH [Bacillus horti]
MQHFRPEEKGFVEKIMEYADHAEKRHQHKLTNFLDPREQFIVQSIVGRRMDITVDFFGGYDHAERKRALIAPSYANHHVNDFQVALLSLEGSYGNPPFEHRDVLGSVLGLGLKREKIGDLLIHADSQQCIVAEEIADFVSVHLHQVHRCAVSCDLVSLNRINPGQEDWQYKDTTVSSLRLDVILAELLPLSRSKTVPMIKAGKIKVNWRVVEQPSMILDEGDVLSVKGFGRFLFSKIEGRTKKDRLRVQLGKKSV